MIAEHWSREEIEDYCEHPNLLAIRVNAMQSQKVHEVVSLLLARIRALFKG